MTDKQLNKKIEKTIAWLETHGWCTGEYAKDAKGNPVSPQSKEATNFCMLGAYRAANNVAVVPTSFDKRWFSTFDYDYDPQDYNDFSATKKERVIGRLKKMII